MRSLTRHGFETLEIVGADPNIRVRAAYFGSPADASRQSKPKLLAYRKPSPRMTKNWGCIWSL